MIIYRGMFPYNDEENAWISKTQATKVKALNNKSSIFLSVLMALTIALLSTTIPLLIYFFRLNLL